MDCRKFLFSVFATFLLFHAADARAQMWLDPAYPDRPALGPAKAAGAVIWSHGRSIDTEDSKAPSPPYMEVLRAGGWDTFRFNRLRVSDTLSNSARGLVEEVHRLKAQGYHQVALAGQSFGGFLALMAADASDEVDAVVVTAPAAYGSFSEFYDSWRNNATKLYPLLDQVRHARVMVFYFHGDDFDPGGRGERSRAILASRQLPHVVIDQPAQLTTHWAAATPQFAKLYGGCILGFLDALRVNEGATCRGDSFWAGDVMPLRPAAATAVSTQAQGSAGTPAPQQ
jgi:pimeloyl-ACP methyl ester carboxylesterase